MHGRPERRYCSATHRAAARQVRRAAIRDGSAARDEVTEILPWLAVVPTRAAAPSGPAREDCPTGPVLRPVARRAAASRAPGTEPGVVARAAAHRSRDNRRSGSGGRHALVVIGVAGLVAGGYAITPGVEAPAAPAPVQVAPPDAATSPEGWVERATVALVAVNRQLDTLARAEEQWERLSASRGGDVPAPLVALAQRRVELQQRRSTLQTQLDAHRSLRTTQDDLRASEQRLRDVEQALAQAPAPRAPAAGQEAAAVALAEQRDLTIRRRDAQSAELRRLEDRVSAASRTPLPDDAATTAKISADVLGVVRGGGAVRDDATSPPGGGVTGPPRGGTTPPRSEESEPTTRPTTRPAPRPMSEPERDASDPSPRRDGSTLRPGTTAKRTPAGSMSPVSRSPVSMSPVSMPTGSVLSGSVLSGSVLSGSTLLVESEGDTVALLHEHARRVAREARRAEGTDAAARAREGAPASAPTGAGRPRSTESASPSAAVRAVPSPGLSPGPSPGPSPGSSAGSAAVASADRDDDAIEELNAARWTALRAGSWRHRPSA